MKPAPFTYHRAPSLDAALTVLATHGAQAKPLAGGQSLVPMMNLRLAQPAHLVDLNDLLEWQRIWEEPEHLVLGFLNRHHQVAQSERVKALCPLMAQMVQTIGHEPIRHRGTLGGSLANADPAAQWVLLAITLEAEICLRSTQGERWLPAREFFLAAMTTAARADELLVAIRVPKARAGEVHAYEMFNRRHGDYALAAVALTLEVHDGVVRTLRLGVAGGTPVPQGLHALAPAFCAQVPDAAWCARLAQAVRDAFTPDDDPEVPATYRRDLVHTLTLRALASATSSLQKVHA